MKKYCKKNSIILMVIGVVLIGTGLFMNFKNSKDYSDNDFDINSASSFFLEIDGKSALFNSKGKNLTGFIFDWALPFVNKTARVRIDETYGIIDENGKVLIDYGKYDYYDQIAGMYLARDNDYKKYLITNNGKVLYDMEDKEVYSSSLYAILVDNDNNTYTILNYDGKVLKEFPMTSSIDEELGRQENDGYLDIYYHDKNYIFNIETAKLVTSFDSKGQYCIKQGIDDKTFLLGSCGKYELGEGESMYRIIKNGKVFDLGEQCDSIDYDEDVKLFTCKKGNSNYLLDDNFNLGIDIAEAAYTSATSYVVNEGNGNYGAVDFYNDGNIKTVNCRVIKDEYYMTKGIYMLRTYNARGCHEANDYYEYYNSDGESIFNKKFKYASGFSKNGTAIVSEDKDNYYLIDTSGNKISDTYDDISGRIVTKGGLKGLINETGKLLVDCKYEDIEIRSNNNKYYAVMQNGSSYVIYNVTDEVEILTLDSIPSFEPFYISINNSTKETYYNYDGKVLYEIKFKR